MSLYDIFFILGIATYVLLTLTVLIGLFGRKLFHSKWFKIHRAVAIITFLIATAHAVIAIFFL